MGGAPQKAESHLLRLTLLMFDGALIPILLPPIGNRLEFWVYAAPWAQALVGALLGLTIEVCLRLKPRTERERS